MFADKLLAAAWRSRVARDHGVDIVVGAWSGESADVRGARFASLGDLPRAGDCGGGGWRQLAQQDVLGALRTARTRLRDEGTSGPMALLEAEALFAAGAVVASLNRLGDLHRNGHVSATVALARRRYLLGDYQGAGRVAATLPYHAHTALLGARAALAENRPLAALRLIDPFMEGAAPIPEPAVAGAFAAVCANALARSGNGARLQRFAAQVLSAPDLAPDMMPSVARAGWTGGLAKEAWERFAGDDPWAVAARVELAILAGDGELASRLLTRVGAVGAPAAATLLLLRGPTPQAGAADEVFASGRHVHLWRTHPHRWRPWIEAAQSREATVEVYDLARERLPDEQALPDATLDDGSLVELIDPLPVRTRPIRGRGAWIDAPLCSGAGLGRDWPADESRRLVERLATVERDRAAVWVMGADAALAHVHSGQAIVVVAPPGDPFWNGPLPSRAWPAVRVVQSDPREGWNGAGERVVQVVDELLGGGA